MTVRISPLAAAGFLMLGSVNAWLFSVLIRHDVPDDPIVTGSLGTPTKLQALADPSPITAYSQTLAQPVFFKTRAPFTAPPPPAPPTTVVAAPVQTDPGLMLGGVMVNGNMKKAYLFTKADPRGTWIDEGQNFMGWQVQSIQSASALLQQQNRKIELHLYPLH